MGVASRWKEYNAAAILYLIASVLAGKFESGEVTTQLAMPMAHMALQSALNRLRKSSLRPPAEPLQPEKDTINVSYWSWEWVSFIKRFCGLQNGSEETGKLQKTQSLFVLEDSDLLGIEDDVSSLLCYRARNNCRPFCPCTGPKPVFGRALCETLLEIAKLS